MDSTGLVFRTPMVKQLLKEIAKPTTGKTQTRRVIYPQPEPDKAFTGPFRYAPGEKLWVKENWAVPDLFSHPSLRGTGPFYQASEPALNVTWKIANVMPKALSRITLLLTEVRAQRLQDISDADCEAEGIESEVVDMCILYTNYLADARYFYTWPGALTYEDGYTEPDKIQKRAFSSLWDSVNGLKAGRTWADNPWVYALTFKPVLANINNLFDFDNDD